MPAIHCFLGQWYYASKYQLQGYSCGRQACFFSPTCGFPRDSWWATVCRKRDLMSLREKFRPRSQLCQTLIQIGPSWVQESLIWPSVGQVGFPVPPRCDWKNISITIEREAFWGRGRLCKAFLGLRRPTRGLWKAFLFSSWNWKCLLEASKRLSEPWGGLL